MLPSILSSFKNKFNGEPSCIVRAPGRVNLIGEHTDYNDGFVLPMAIDRAVWIGLRPRKDRRVILHALDLGKKAVLSLDGAGRAYNWSDYLIGMAWSLQMDGYDLRGWEGVMAGNVPRGAGLSSSAAVEVAVARAFASVSGFEWDALWIAKIGQRAENDWLGVKTGIMDQAVSAAAKAGHAFFLDCRTLEYQHIHLPKEIAVVVMDTSTRRGLVASAYNERREQCETAARLLGVKALRDASVEQLQIEVGMLKEIILKRARHVITENERVLQAVDAMRNDDPATLGRLFNESHASLRDDFEVTNDALNWMVEIAQAQSACLGARMTGAGFGGCAVALVRRDQAGAFAGAVSAEYRAKSGTEAKVYVCQASEGASVIE